MRVLMFSSSRVLRVFAVIVLLVAASGCAGWPKAPSKADPRMVYVWPADQCPSLVGKAGEAHVAPVIAALATTLIGNSINTILGIPASALSAAAAADKEGFKMSGTNARYYYSAVSTPLPSNPAQTTLALKAPACYVVALTQPRDTPATVSNWCGDTSFKTALADTCSTDGENALKALGMQDVFHKDGTRALNHRSAEANLEVPELYAEITFVDSSYPDIALPTVAAIYYPRSLLANDTKKLRTIGLGITITSPIATDPFKSASLALVLPAVEPGLKGPKQALSRLQTGWVARPLHGITAPAEAELAKIEQNGGRYLPVTMAATLTEAGDPSVFLASFAAAFGSQASTNALTTAAMNSFSVTGGPSVNSQQLQQAQINYTKALGAALATQSQLVKLCSGPAPLSAADKVNARSIFEATISNQLAANLAAQIAFAPVPFESPQTVADVDPTCWQ